MADVVRAPRRPLTPEEPARAALNWLPDAHWGTAETPLPPVDDDDPDDVDPDDEVLGETPADVIAMLGFDPLDELDGLAMDAGEWDENKHPREDDGKFGSGGGGGGKAKLKQAAEGLLPHSNTSSSALKKVHSLGKQALENDEDPHAFATKLIAATNGWKHPTIASYANKVLRHVEAAHALPFNELGKAVPQGGAPIWPKKPAGAEKPAPASMKEQMAEAKAFWEKTAAAAPESKPAPTLTPEPAEGSGHQSAMAKIANDPAITNSKNKATEITVYMQDFDDELTEADAAYGEALLAHLDAFKTAAIPEPHESSTGQKLIHTIATGAGSNADKVAGIKEAMAQTPSSYPPGGYAQMYADQVIEALGGKPQAEAEAAAVPSAKTVKAKVETPRVAAARQLLQGAKRFPNTQSAAAEKACPTLKHEWWEKNVGKSVLQAVQSYTGSAYGSINAVYRNPNDKHSTATIKAANDIEALFFHPEAALTEDTILRRGENVPKEKIDAWRSGLAQGISVTNHRDGFTSASMAANAAFGSKNVIFEIAVRKGTKCVGVANVSAVGKGENEVLLMHGQTFDVTEIEETKPGKYIVRMAQVV